MANAAKAAPAPDGSATRKRKAQIALVSIAALSGALSALLPRCGSPSPAGDVAAGASLLFDGDPDRDPANRSPATQRRAEQAAEQSYSERRRTPPPRFVAPRFTPPPLNLDLPPVHLDLPPPLERDPPPPPPTEPPPVGDGTRRHHRPARSRHAHEAKPADGDPRAGGNGEKD